MESQSRNTVLSVILWLLIILNFVVTVLADAFPATLSSPLNTPLGVLTPLAFGVIHGAIRYRYGIIVFLVVCLVVSNIMENIGVLTGFPFGHYHYTDVLGTKLFLVPLLIGPGYFGTGYVSWVLANVILGTDRRRDALATFAVPVVATFIMVGWDVALDPGEATVGHAWIWEKGGGYFGVPLVNYLGWFLTVYIFMQLFALYRARWPEPSIKSLPRDYWYQACAMFAVIGLDYPAAYYSVVNKPITDATGKVWQTSDIFESTAMVSLYTVIFVAVASFFVLLLRGSKASEAG